MPRVYRGVVCGAVAAPYLAVSPFIVLPVLVVVGAAVLRAIGS